MKKIGFFSLFEEYNINIPLIKNGIWVLFYYSTEWMSRGLGRTLNFFDFEKKTPLV